MSHEFHNYKLHYNVDIMSAITSQITSLAIVYSIVNSGADERKHQSSASLAFVQEIHRWPVYGQFSIYFTIWNYFLMPLIFNLRCWGYSSCVVAHKERPEVFWTTQPVIIWIDRCSQSGIVRNMLIVNGYMDTYIHDLVTQRTRGREASMVCILPIGKRRMSLQWRHNERL